MYIGRLRDTWSRTSEILAMTAEINRDRKKRSRPFSGYDFMPEVVRPRRPKTPIDPNGFKYFEAMFRSGLRSN